MWSSLSKRLRTFIVDEMRYKFKSVYHLTDSQIFKSMISKTSYGFNTFVANRIGDIQEKTEQSEWLWIPGKVNISDWLTRGKKPQDLQSSSLWQQGPQFLEKPIDEWPVSKDWVLNDLPEMVKSFTAVTQVTHDSLQQGPVGYHYSPMLLHSC